MQIDFGQFEMLPIIPGIKVGGVRIPAQSGHERRWDAEEPRPLSTAAAVDEQLCEDGMRLQAVGSCSRGRIHGQETFHAVDGRFLERFLVLWPIHVLEHQLGGFVVEGRDAWAERRGGEGNGR